MHMCDERMHAYDVIRSWDTSGCPGGSQGLERGSSVGSGSLEICSLAAGSL